MVKNLPACRRPSSIPVSGRSPGEGNATHSSILVWRVPRTGDPGRLQSRGCEESDMTEWLALSTLVTLEWRLLMHRVSSCGVLRKRSGPSPGTPACGPQDGKRTALLQPRILELSSHLTAAAGDQGYSMGYLGSCSVGIFGDELLCILRYQHEFSSGPR